MNWTRRGFLRTLMMGAAVLPLANSGVVSDLLLAEGPVQDDVGLLNDLERASFDFFWNEADPRTGLVRDRAPAGGGAGRLRGSIAATGFGLTALCIGHQRGYGASAEIEHRVRGTLEFLAEKAPQHHGFFYHFLDIRNGRRSGHSELSPVDTAILLCGVLTCRAYFDDPAVRAHAARIYERVEWPWALNGESTFALSWTPEHGFSELRWDSYCESMMLYLLAIGSPAYPIAPQCWHRIRRPWLQYDKYRFISSASPLFIHQFSHAWFDFRGKQDDYTDYFANSVLACQAHRRFCENLSPEFPSYAGGVWGITASDSARGYVAWGGPPIEGPIDGTVVPAAAAGSLPFVFNDAISALRVLRSQYGAKIWRRYGFVDAFNPLTGWVSSDVLGIDVGISMLMAENARSQFVWNTFMRNAEARIAMEKAGFSSLKTPAALYVMDAARNSRLRRANVQQAPSVGSAAGS